MTAHQWHGDNLMYLARTDDAIREARAAVALDPLSSVADNDLAYNLVSAGQFDEAIRAAHRALEIDSTLGYSQMYLGLGFAFAQRPDSAAQMFDRLFRGDSLLPTARGYRVWEFALAGRWPEAERELASIERMNPGGERDVDLVIANVAMGNNAAALDALEHATRTRSFYATNIAWGCDPTFGLLKSEPRFAAARKQLGQSLCVSKVKWPIPARPGH